MCIRRVGQEESRNLVYINISLTHLKYPTASMVYLYYKDRKTGKKRNNSCKMEEYSNRTGSLSRTNGAHGPPGLTEGNIWSRRELVPPLSRLQFRPMRQISNSIQPEKKNKIKKKTKTKNMMDTLYTGTRSRWRKTRPNEKGKKGKSSTKL